MFAIIGVVLRWLLGFFTGSQRKDEIALGKEQQTDADQKAAIKEMDQMLRDKAKPTSPSQAENDLEKGTF